MSEVRMFVWVAMMVIGWVAVSASSAWACWDGYQASLVAPSDDPKGPEGPRVVLERSFDMDQPVHTYWSADTARELAEWLPRLERIVPDGEQVIARDGYVLVERASRATVNEPDFGIIIRYSSARQLFNKLVLHYQVPRTTVREALALKSEALTVQLGSYHSRQMALKKAEELNDTAFEALGELDELQSSRVGGFYRAGAWPGYQPILHVARHGDYWAVVTSPTLHREDAELMRRLFQSSHGLKGYVRPL